MALARQTLVIAVVCAALGLIVVLVVFYRIITSCRRRARASPLPPIQPLSHEREFRRAQFEASYGRNSAFLAPPPLPSLGNLSSGGSKTSLLGSFNSPRASYITTTVEGSEELSNSSPLESSASFPASRMPASSSSLNLSQSPSPLRQSSRPRRDDQHRHRPTSLTPSRGVPHARHSLVQIVLPAPLGTNILPSSHERDAARDRMSIVDRWVPADRDSNEKVPPRPRRAASNPNTKNAISGRWVDNESTPPSSFTVGGQVPSQTRDGDGRGRKLTKRVA
ncbi:hypothetical protein AGABI2DRAFT_133204 [Agaricus bisporus var. bisporus H97]|uniref:hypothetical protein n=1 Tax=Agaricus bisporus var. bisporus (strain H97 / ATCC MYA-4626 / FGSC 10389) TaxID=936046 RepID=UPI00029F6363|nr:hypothetical protein AGABI2DRAFT_133204 [Agaricus bisporus var. bisporus H97]EKV51540.1 hypothetical protein AGABI2DRAFT_133204 [Agaricus bisporus var. bisporus H97]